MKMADMMARAEALIAEVSDLPTIPVVATQVMSLLDKPDVELDEVADMILTDQVLAARVIKIVNSPLYRAAQEIRSVKRALIYLGFRHIRELILTCSFIEAVQDKGGAFDIRNFWVHSFGVGVVARIIAQRARYADIEKAYLAGLVHDIGEVVLSHYLQSEFQPVLEAVRVKAAKFYDVEQEQLGTTHCEIGHAIATKWNFPPDYREVILHHHDPEKASLDPLLSAIVNLADLFCSVRELDMSDREWVSFNLADEQAWDILRRFAPEMADLDIERFCYELDDRVPEIQELVKSIFEGMALED